MFLLKAYRPERFRETRATVPANEINKLIEAEFKRLAAKESKEQQDFIAAPVN